jgi:thiazole synthase
VRHETIQIRGLEPTRFWHCFGTERHRVPIERVLGLLDASGTNVLPINTHRLDRRRRRDALEHGFGGVTYDGLAQRRDLSGYVKMLNINLRQSAAEATEAAKLAYDMTGEPVVKLEVLEPDLRASRDVEVVEAARTLMAWEPCLVVLPLISTNPAAASAAVDAGCSLLRVMGSPISSRAGIADEPAFKEICSLPVPVVLDGGVGSVSHLHRAADLGAQGVLVNSVLFDDGRDPLAVMAQFAEAATRAFGRTEQ